MRTDDTTGWARFSRFTRRSTDTCDLFGSFQKIFDLERIRSRRLFAVLQMRTGRAILQHAILACDCQINYYSTPIASYWYDKDLLHPGAGTMRPVIISSLITGGSVGGGGHTRLSIMSSVTLMIPERSGGSVLEERIIMHRANSSWSTLSRYIMSKSLTIAPFITMISSLLIIPAIIMSYRSKHYSFIPNDIFISYKKLFTSFRRSWKFYQVSHS